MVNKCKISIKTDLLSTKLLEYISDSKNDPLTTFRYDLKHLTPFTCMSIQNIVLKTETVSSTSIVFNIKICSAKGMTLELTKRQYS